MPKNMVRLMTIIAEEALIEHWNPELNNAKGFDQRRRHHGPLGPQGERP